jgi:uncharacterized surface protein with fasciclin (FAS1) repeats
MKERIPKSETLAVLQRFALLSRTEAEAVLRARERGEKCYVEAVARVSPDPEQFIAAALKATGLKNV